MGSDQAEPFHNVPEKLAIQSQLAQPRSSPSPPILAGGPAIRAPPPPSSPPDVFEIPAVETLPAPAPPPPNFHGKPAIQTPLALAPRPPDLPGKSSLQTPLSVATPPPPPPFSLSERPAIPTPHITASSNLLGRSAIQAPSPSSNFPGRLAMQTRPPNFPGRPAMQAPSPPPSNFLGRPAMQTPPPPPPSNSYERPAKQTPPPPSNFHGRPVMQTHPAPLPSNFPGKPNTQTPSPPPPYFHAVPGQTPLPPQPPPNFPIRPAAQTPPPPPSDFSGSPFVKTHLAPQTPHNFSVRPVVQTPPPLSSNFPGSPAMHTPPAPLPNFLATDVFQQPTPSPLNSPVRPAAQMQPSVSPNSLLSPPLVASNGSAVTPFSYSSPFSCPPLNHPPHLPNAKPTVYPYPLPPLQQQFSPIPMRPSLPISAGLNPSAPPILDGYAKNGQLKSPPCSPPLFNQQWNYPVGSLPGPKRVDSMSPVQGLVEEFSSLSIPASEDLLPRPVWVEVEDPSSLFAQNCHSRYFRLTTNAIPNSKSLLSRWHFPLGAVMHPLAEAPDGEEIPTVNFGPSGIVRCRVCRTYVNPYVTFVDSGRKWLCNLCHHINDVYRDYFSELDANGRRFDADQRPELSKGSVEFIAPEDYMFRPPMPPLYFFLIDVSITAVRSGLLEVVAKTIKCCLDGLPGFPRTQIGFITYDSALHFYNLKSSLTQPQMMVVSDLEDIFVPLPDELLVNLSESRNMVDAFLDTLPSMFQSSEDVESAFGPALKAAFLIMNQLGGKLLIFQSTLPSLGVGRRMLRGYDHCRDGTDKEPSIRGPEDPFYRHMAANMTWCHIGVSVYAFSEKYTDIATLGTLAKYTCGQVYYYFDFQEEVHGEKLRHDIKRDLTRETAWEAFLRIRCGKGISLTNCHGHLMKRTQDSMSLPALNCDKTFALQFLLDESLFRSQAVYFQIALLYPSFQLHVGLICCFSGFLGSNNRYTSSSGERRIRVHTAAAAVVQKLEDSYCYADAGAIVAVLCKQGVEKTMYSKLEDVRRAVQMMIVKGLKEFRSLYAAKYRLTGKMIFPENLKYLPLYELAISKSIAFGGGSAQVDERCAAGHIMLALPIKRLLKFLYPTLSRIDEYLLKNPIDIDDVGSIVKPLPLKSKSLDPKGLYLLDNGFHFILWLGHSLSPEVTFNLLGEVFPITEKVTLSERDNNISRKLISLLKRIRERDPFSYQLCRLVRQGDPEESIFLSSLIEDGAEGSVGYGEYIQQIYQQVEQGF